MERESILSKIRALLSKTVTNGCSEQEALAALAKARAMMDAYEVTDSDLELTKQEGAALHAVDKRDLHGIRSYLAMAVSAFTETRAFKTTGTGRLTFVGIRADTDLAHYLLDALQTFVLGELTEYLAAHPVDKAFKRSHINGFVIGATNRISERLRALVAQSKANQSSNSTALVVCKQGLIKDALAANNVNIGKARRRSRQTNYDAYNAGRAAGDRASFGRPVGGNGSTRAIS